MGHKCFISFKTEDLAYKIHIQNILAIDMIDKSLDVPINSTDEDYILKKIREDYLSDSSVTIHLIGTRSGENLGAYEQRFIKRELQASLYNGENSPRSGVLGVVLPGALPLVYRDPYSCSQCGMQHNCVVVEGHTIKEFSYNFYLPHEKCSHTELERYCVLAKWDEFCNAPNTFIDAAFAKRSSPIANKVRVRGGQ